MHWTEYWLLQVVSASAMRTWVRMNEDDSTTEMRDFGRTIAGHNIQVHRHLARHARAEWLFTLQVGV